jgi:hypothetical protein
MALGAAARRPASAGSVLSKPSSRNRVQAVVLAHETGLVTPGA